MKGINARATLISLFFGLAAVTQGPAEEYYVYQTPSGAPVISNKEPPPGSKIIKQLSLPEDPQAQEAGKPQLNLQADSRSQPGTTRLSAT